MVDKETPSEACHHPIPTPKTASVSGDHAFQPPGSLSIWTLVGWTVLLMGGLLGWFCTPARPHWTRTETVLEFKLEPAPEPLDLKTPTEALEPAPPELPSSLAIPQPTPVTPSPSLLMDTRAEVLSIGILHGSPASVSQPAAPHAVFAEPSAPMGGTGPMKGSSSPAQPTPSTPAPPGKERLTFGMGEGKQPRPEYPATARGRRQQGTVMVELWVDAEGRVFDVIVAQPCAWPLLNEAAREVVAKRWNFGAGPPRHYEVAIQFELTR